jgi:hypothetical protein
MYKAIFWIFLDWEKIQKIVFQKENENELSTASKRQNKIENILAKTWFTTLAYREMCIKRHKNCIFNIWKREKV